MEISPIPIIIYREKKIVDANPAAEDIWGYSKKEFLRILPAEIIHPDSRDTFERWNQELLNQAELESKYELSILAKDGQEKLMKISAGVIQIEDETVIIATFK